MMQRDEISLLPVFLRYHEALFGGSSLHVFDNGSTDPSVIAELKASEARGVKVYRDHPAPKSFEDKGAIFAALIQSLDELDPHDFYFPLDCDEFIACATDDGISLGRSEIEQVLIPFKDSPSTLRIGHKYWANPLHRNRYQMITWSPKCFFAKGACASLDHGYHDGKSRASAPDQVTPIVYFEFHYKTYLLHRRNSAAKLVPFLSDHSRRNLRGFHMRRYHNHHCAEDLLMSKYDYLSMFSFEHYAIKYPAFLQRLHDLGIEDRLLFEAKPSVGIGLWMSWLKLRRHVVNLQATTQEQLQDCRDLAVQATKRLLTGS